MAIGMFGGLGAAGPAAPFAAGQIQAAPQLEAMRRRRQMLMDLLARMQQQQGGMGGGMGGGMSMGSEGMAGPGSGMAPLFDYNTFLQAVIGR